MAWTSAAVTAAELADLAADKPMLASQAIPISPDYCKWVESAQVGAGNITTWTDRADTDLPTRYAYDGLLQYYTETDGTSASTWYLAFDFGEAITFDCAFIIHHNFESQSCTAVQLEVADDNAFSTNLTTVGSFTLPGTGDDTRLQDIVLEHGGAAQRYTTQFAWLKVTKGSAFTPRIGELFLCRRRQLPFKPNRPFGDRDLFDEIATSRSMGGVVRKTIYHRRRHDFYAELLLDESTNVDDAEAFFQECRGYFIWVYDPNSAPGSFRYMARDEDSLVMPMTEPNVYEFKLAATEQGPEQYFLDQE